MSWFFQQPPPGPKRRIRRVPRLSLELPIVIAVDAAPAPVHGTLISISDNACRFRSLILIDRKRVIHLELKRPGRDPLFLHGPITERSTPLQGGGYEYDVSFAALDGALRDELASELLELQRREAVARTRPRADQAAPAPPSQRRKSVRASIDFSVRYRLLGERTVIAHASDVSTGGLRLLCNEELMNNATIELRFTLPSEVLDVFPPSEKRTEISPFGERTVRMPDKRRPFAPMILRARVIARLPRSQGRIVYGVEFLEIDGFQREEIARFVHAAQLQRLR